MKVNIDFDNTIIDTITVMVDYLNRKYGERYTAKNIYSYDFKKVYKEITDEEFYPIFDTDGFYDNAILYDHFLEFFFRFCGKIPLNMITVGSNISFKNKIKFLQQNGLVMDDYLECKKHKGEYDLSGQILIDDKSEELRKSNATIKILFRGCGEKEWNRLEVGDDFYVVDNWIDIINIVEFANGKGAEVYQN